jgi:tetratricopeptide (TPR) repeat protein
MSPDGKRLALGCRNGKVLLLDAATTTPEMWIGREAYRVVHSLFDELVLESVVIDRLKNGEYSTRLRDEAIGRAKKFLQDPQLLNQQSWAVVRRPDATPPAYERALLQAREACRLAPDTGELLNTLGVAEYRTKQWDAALKTLTDADRRHSARLKSSHPADLAFLAMTHHQLGNSSRAAELLARARKIAKQNPWAKDKEVEQFLKEAEALLATPPANAKGKGQ